MQRTYRLSLQGPINISERSRAALIALGKPRRYTDGQFIMQQGDKPRGFFAVVSGQVMVGRYGGDGNLTIFGVAGAGDLFGEQAFLVNQPRLADAVADGAVEVVHIDGTVFRKLIATDPDLSMLIIRSLAQQLYVATQRLDSDRMTLAGRLAQVLLSMESDGDQAVTCTQQQLADLIGVSRVSLGMAVRQLEKAGAIAGGYGKVRIVDRTLLEQRLVSVAGGVQR